MNAAIGVAFAGVFVAGLGLVVTYVNGHADRRHTRQLAHDERLFARRSDVYVDLLNFVFRQRDVVARTYRMLEAPGMPGPPPDLPEDEVRLLEARLVAYRSPDTFAVLESVNAKLQEFRYEVETLRALERAGQGREPGTDYWKHHQQLQQVKSAIGVRIQALADQVAAELTKQPGSARGLM
jgi:hypothetical protein